MTTLISIENLKISYKKGAKKGDTHTILDDISLSLNKGSLVALIGINGIGKSSLLRTMVGLQKPTKGKVLMDNQDLSQLKSSEIAKQVKWVDGKSPNINHLDVYQFISMGRYPYTNFLGKLEGVDKNIIEDAMSLTQTSTLKDRVLTSLSDGEKQRVNLAQALTQETGVILLDEPTAHLDIPTRHKTMRLLKDLCKEHEKTILLSTHELDLAIQYADEIWLMHDQKVTVGLPNDDKLSALIKEVFYLE